MDEPATVFYLEPLDDIAVEIVEDEANHKRRRVHPTNVAKCFLRIGLDLPAKILSRLVTFSRTPSNGDVILSNTRFSNTDQCYFDFHPTTGELLLHDISKNNDTQLSTADGDDTKQIWQSPRQCVVQLKHEWIFHIGRAKFRLIPRRAPTEQDQEAFTADRLAFVRQIPDEFRTFQGTLEGLSALGMQSMQSDASTITARSYSLRVRHPDGLKPGEEIRYAAVRVLGAGGQGTVNEVVNLHNGEHYARKEVPWKEIPEWKIDNESKFKARVKKEVDLVKKAKHPHIIPYLFHEGWEEGKVLAIYMPVCEGNLQNLLEKLRSKEPRAVRPMTDMMLSQILGVLDHLHGLTPPIIHRDIKLENILHNGNAFFLTDFGIAKDFDVSRTMVGTKWYVPPEVRQNGKQTTKCDIFQLGVTVVGCLVKLPPEAEREVIWQHWEQWHRHLQTLLSQHEPRMAAMLADVADQRPTAHQLRRDLFPHTSLQNAQTNATSSSFGVSSLTNQANGTTMISSAVPTPMEWTRTGTTAFFQGNPQPAQRDESTQPPQPNSVAVRSPKVPPNRPAQPGFRRKGSVKSAKSVDERQKKSHKRGGSSQNTPPQSAGVPKRTSSRRQRSRSKSIRKAQEIRVLLDS